MQDYQQTVIAEFSNSTALLTVLEGFNQNVDPADNLNNFYDLIWDVSSAEGYGLDVWGRIVGVNRVLQVAETQYFGFQQGGTLAIAGFDQAIFFRGEALTTNYALTDDGFRTLIYAKALANISDLSVPAINKVLQTLFSSYGNAYCTDGENMTMTYTFNFNLTPVQYSIVATSGVLPRPVGVAVSIVQT
jgi:hypothetical protein